MSSARARQASIDSSSASASFMPDFLSVSGTKREASAINVRVNAINRVEMAFTSGVTATLIIE